MRPGLVVDPLEIVARQALEESPTDRDRLLDTAARAALRDQLAFEAIREVARATVGVAESGLADDRRHHSRIAAARIDRVQLVGPSPMFAHRLTRADAGVHEP